MTDSIFPPLELEEWRGTRDIIQGYAQILSRVRAALTPRQKHQWHTTLHSTATGLTTTPIYGGIFNIEIHLDFIGNLLLLTTSRGEVWQKPLHQVSPFELCRQTIAVFKDLGFNLEIDCDLYSASLPENFSENAIEQYWRAATQLDAVFRIFKGELREETSPVHFWPDRFELEFTWFSGRRVPGIDPADAQKADESVTFGFSTGNLNVPEPYFYATPYPITQSLLDAPLPEEVFWNSRGFQALLLKYEVVRQADNPQEKLIQFLRQIQKLSKELMK